MLITNYCQNYVRRKYARTWQHNIDIQLKEESSLDKIFRSHREVALDFSLR